MNVTKYKYYITYTCASNRLTREVFPLGVDKLQISYVKADGRIFTRRELNGRLVFIDQPLIPSTDYSLFRSIDLNIDEKCCEILFDIHRSCDDGTTYDVFWNGYFSVVDGEFNIDKCIFTVEATPNDEYRCYIEGIDDEVNLATVTVHADGMATIIPQYEYFTDRSAVASCSTLPAPQPCLTWHILHTELIDGVNTTIYYREVTIIACQGGSPINPGGGGNQWYQDTTHYNAFCENGLSKWVRLASWVPVSYAPNPEVFPGNCDESNNPTPPPRRASLLVTKQATTATPIIRGKTVQSAALCLISEWYTVDNNPGSTYLWNNVIGATIVSGSTTNEVEVDISGAGSIDVVETTSCGASSTATISWTLGTPAYNANTKLIGRTEVCAGAVERYYFNTNILGTGTSLQNIGNPDVITSIVNLGNGVFEITFGTTWTGTPNFQLIFSGGGVCTASNIGTSGLIVAHPITPPIQGLSTVCNSQQSTYFIPTSDSNSSYVWEVTGGTITTGQGTNQINVTWNGINGSGTITVQEVRVSCLCAWLLITGTLPNDESSCILGPPFYWCPDETTFDIINNTSLEDVVNFIKDDICPGSLDVKSDFFEWDPPGDTPGYVPGINYVTGLQNHLTHLSIIPLRAMIYSFTGNFDYFYPTEKETLSWGQIEDILREVFNAYWFIENGVVRIEHISWFNRTVKFDLTDAYYHKYSIGKNIYSYDKIKAPKFERFEWQQAINTDFVGAEISYSGACITTEEGQMVKNRGVTFINTDILYLNTLGTDMGIDGFALLDFGVSGTSLVLQSEIGLISGLLLPNAHLSWANLHFNYHRYDRVLLQGMMNLTFQNFFTALKFKKQDGVTFPYCCGDVLETLNDLIRTLVGDGIVDSAEHNLKSDELTVNLLHDF